MAVKQNNLLTICNNIHTNEFKIQFQQDKHLIKHWPLSHIFIPSIPCSNCHLGLGRQLSTEIHLERWILQDELNLSCGLSFAPPVQDKYLTHRASQKTVRDYLYITLIKPTKIWSATTKLLQQLNFSIGDHHIVTTKEL